MPSVGRPAKKRSHRIAASGRPSRDRNAPSNILGRRRRTAGAIPRTPSNPPVRSRRCQRQCGRKHPVPGLEHLLSPQLCPRVTSRVLLKSPRSLRSPADAAQQSHGAPPQSVLPTQQTLRRRTRTQRATPPRAVVAKSASSAASGAGVSCISRNPARCARPRTGSAKPCSTGCSSQLARQPLPGPVRRQRGPGVRGAVARARGSAIRRARSGGRAGASGTCCGLFVHRSRACRAAGCLRFPARRPRAAVRHRLPRSAVRRATGWPEACAALERGGWLQREPSSTSKTLRPTVHPTCRRAGIFCAAKKPATWAIIWRAGASNTIA